MYSCLARALFLSVCFLSSYAYGAATATLPVRCFSIAGSYERYFPVAAKLNIQKNTHLEYYRITREIITQEGTFLKVFQERTYIAEVEKLLSIAFYGQLTRAAHKLFWTRCAPPMILTELIKLNQSLAHSLYNTISPQRGLVSAQKTMDLCSKHRETKCLEPHTKLLAFIKELQNYIVLRSQVLLARLVEAGRPLDESDFLVLQATPILSDASSTDASILAFIKEIQMRLHVTGCAYLKNIHALPIADRKGPLLFIVDKVDILIQVLRDLDHTEKELPEEFKILISRIFNFIYNFLRAHKTQESCDPRYRSYTLTGDDGIFLGLIASKIEQWKTSLTQPK